MKRRTALLALSTLGLSACGFQLRGSGRQSALRFKTLHIAGNNGGLAFALRRMIEAGNGTTVVDDPKQAEAIIDILGEARDRGTITLNTQGRIREYSLYYRVNFRVRGAAGQEMLAPTLIVLRRDLSFNEAQAIAKEREEEMLFRDMQGDAVQQILRRLAAIH
ncbi:MAG TPA: LPS assembly lipoprotein LptE [Noviherbaspirillum sp.]|nr:LPS assembly lipoprotein LptE [Noviherbaspirillum sp.]